MSWTDVNIAPQTAASELGVNLGRGLQRWKMGVGKASKTLSGVDLGGVDIVLLGDSISFGFHATKPYHDGWFHRLKLMLQAKYNPPGVQGGYGFYRAAVGSDRQPDNLTATGSITEGTTNDGSGGAWLQLAVAAGKANRITYLFDGSGSPNTNLRHQITDLEIVYTKAPSANSNATCDIGTVDPAGGNGNVFANQAIDGSGGGQTNGNRILYTGLNRAASNYVQIASGPTSGGLAFYFEGVIAYDGDKTSGVRCHNLAFPSCASNWISPSANKLNTNIGRFCTGSGTGATNAKLVIVAIGANDCGTAANPNVDVATHIANVTAMVDSALSQPSKPCVMLLVYPWRCDAGGVIYGRSTSHPKDYISAAYQIASNRPDVCVVDLNRLAGSKLYYNSASDNSYVSMLSPSGWNDADLVHLHNNAQSAIANLLYAALSS